MSLILFLYSNKGLRVQNAFHQNVYYAYCIFRDIICLSPILLVLISGQLLSHMVNPSYFNLIRC